MENKVVQNEQKQSGGKKVKKVKKTLSGGKKEDKQKKVKKVKMRLLNDIRRT